MEPCPLFIYIRCKRFYMGNIYIEGGNKPTPHPPIRAPLAHPSPTTQVTELVRMHTAAKGLESAAQVFCAGRL